jgi:membrane fusion protein (multidrug efflux system)
MEALVEESGFWEQRKRMILASTVTLVVLIAIAGTIFAINKKKDPGSASGAAATKSDKKKDGDKEKTPVPVSVAAAAVAPVSSYISATANLVAEQEVKIVAESEGRVAQLLVDEGQYVRAGQPLATLVRDDADIAQAKASVRASNARVAFQRASEMMSKELISKDVYDKAKLEKEVAEQELAEAKWRVGKTTIRSPFDGRLTERVVNQGQHLRPGDTLFTVTDFDPLVARLYLPEKDVLALTMGQAVRIRMKAADEIAFKGRIRQIAQVVDPATGTVKVTVEAVQPPPMVRSGAFVNVDIIRETRAGAVVVPRESVVRELRDAHVFIADGAVARKRAVTLGLEEGAVVQTTSGVKPGDKVIVAGQGGLKDGSPIKVLPRT